MTRATVPALRIRSLVVDLGGHEILHGIDLDVTPGEIVGFVGPNGAGKTTTIRTILGIYPPATGTVEVFGHPAGSAPARAQLGFALDKDGLYDGMSATENVAFFQRLYGVPDDAARVREVLTLVGLADRRDDDVRTFSRGMRQRVAIARALVHRPGLIILDEPTSGIDPTGQGEIRALLQRIAQSEGVAVLMSSHNLEEVQRLAARIVVIAAGEVRAAGNLQELRESMGSGTVTITTAQPLSESNLTAISATDTLGLAHHEGTVLTFDPPEGVTRVALVDSVGRYSDVERLTTDDLSLEALFADAVRDTDQANRVRAEREAAKPKGPPGRRKAAERRARREARQR